jgi:cytochrome b subunit of formate dehydrogenase
MEFWRRAANPWGQDVLIGIAWDLMWAAVIVGVVFVAGHALYVKLLTPKQQPEAQIDAGPSAAGIPERIVRHTGAARAFHWLMSVAMFVLLITAFFPVVGIQFPWVTIHWIAGLGLLLTVLYHIWHSIVKQDVWSMWIDMKELKEGTRELGRFLKRSGESRAKAGKYPLDHKLYHHAIAVVTTLAIVTGLLMMFRVDTPLWARNPYILSDQLWGVVYVVHGISGVALITLVMAHVYFAVRPEKWWITLSMINGFIGRKDYLEHHDPERWAVKDGTPTAVSGTPGSAPLREGIPQNKRSHH